MTFVQFSKVTCVQFHSHVCFVCLFVCEAMDVNFWTVGSIFGHRLTNLCSCTCQNYVTRRNVPGSRYDDVYPGLVSRIETDAEYKGTLHT